jgi:hypothetical protein
MQPVGRAREVAMLGDGEQVPDMAEYQSASP